jgi:hypothetical protein
MWIGTPRPAKVSMICRMSARMKGSPPVRDT